MMFLLDAAFAIELIALTVGAGLLIWSLRNQGSGRTLGKVIGFLVLVLSIFVLLCTSYYGLKYWAEGYLEPSANISIKIRNKMTKKLDDEQNEEQKKNMYNMEHLQNMGSEQSMQHMRQK